MLPRLAIGALSLLLLSANLCAAPPHIVVMIADDLGWGDVGFHGSPIHTPNIDTLARRGVELTQFYVQPLCSPTRGAFMTGRYPFRLGLQCGVVRPWATHGLPLTERTLPQALHEAGYKTAICGKWHLGHARPEYLPTRRGFDFQYGLYNGAIDYFTHARDGGHDWHRNDQRSDDQGYSTTLLADAAENVIAQHDLSLPLFLYIPFNAPHSPQQALPEDIAQYADMENEQRRIYAAMVTCMDRAVGKIVTALSTRSFPAENTIIFFCSDNGGLPRYGSNRELRDAKASLYEGGVRVPAVMVCEQKLPAGSVVNEPLHIVDLFPTFLALAGVSVNQPLPLDGRDAWPTIAAGKPTPHDVIVHNITPHHGALRAGDWKLVHNGHVSANEADTFNKETWELFNIPKDMSEMHDQSLAEPQVLARLKGLLEEFAAQAAPAHSPSNKMPRGFKVPTVWGED